MANWKTSLAGILGGLLMLFSPRLQGNTQGPPITLGSVGTAAAIATMGLLAKDHDVTGGDRKQ